MFTKQMDWDSKLTLKSSVWLCPVTCEQKQIAGSCAFLFFWKPGSLVGFWGKWWLAVEGHYIAHSKAHHWPLCLSSANIAKFRSSFPWLARICFGDDTHPFPHLNIFINIWKYHYIYNLPGTSPATKLCHQRLFFWISPLLLDFSQFWRWLRIHSS